MIYTITFSPSLDYVMNVDSLILGEVNRSKKEDYIAGGKGINVSIMLNHLGEESVAMGFVGGFIGDYIQSSLNNDGIKTNFVHIEGNSRINVKINSSSLETAINGNGPLIPQEKINELFEKINKISSGDTLVISGSVPNSLPKNIYENILSICRQKNIITVVDCEKLLLVNTLKYNPFLIKPNQSELEQIFNQKTRFY